MFNFVQVLSDSVKNGHRFEIHGTSKTEAKTISILFSTGTTLESATVLKIDMNFSSNKIIINEASENDIVLECGGKFEFLIDVDNNYFQINLNESNLCEYQSQASADHIRSVIITGDVDRLLKMNHLNKEYPTIAKNDENLAHESFIPIKYQPGHVIVISGECTEEFYVTFPENGKIRELIHFNVRFGENSVVMNTYDENYGWSDTEDRPKEFPFKVNTPFKIAFAFTDEIFKVAVDGNKFMDFSLFRISLNDDQTLWDILSGFRITNRAENTVTKITCVKHIKMKPNCEGFEQYSSLDYA